VPADRVDFRILGPIEVESAAELLALGPTKQRALLAVLLLRANRVVSRDELLDALWGEQPPDTAGAALHGYVSGLRKTLGADRIETRTPGYLFHATSGEIDVERFEQLARRGS
jgi:DNA-binding SARP family transcriptional activator